MTFNLLMLALASLVPLVVGFVWYNPKVFGNAWMKATGLNPDQANTGNMLVIFGMTFLLSFLAAIQLNFITIHQNHVFSLIEGNTNPLAEVAAKTYIAEWGQNFRTFKHGALHGGMAGFFFAMPILGVNALFERKGFAYIAIHTGYWIVTLAIMGGIICGLS